MHPLSVIEQLELIEEVARLRRENEQLRAAVARVGLCGCLYTVNNVSCLLPSGHRGRHAWSDPLAELHVTWM